MILNLSPHLFWDVDASAIDLEQHARFLIPRVMDRGTRDDVRKIWQFYGSDRVRTVLLEAPALDERTIWYFANQFGLAVEDFRAHHASRGVARE